MALANLRVIKELIETINCVASNRELMKPMLTREQAFVRKSKLGFEKVTFLILSMLKRSLNIEIDDFIDTLNLPKEESFTKGAFSQRRHLISSKWFHFLLEYSAKLFYEFSNNIKRWKGYTLLAIDGSTADLISDEEVIKYFEGAKNQHSNYGLCRFVIVYDVLNKIITKAKMTSMSTGELSTAYTFIDSIPDKSITIGDRGFASFAFFYLMGNCERPKDFVVRCKTSFNKEVQKFLLSNKSSDILRFYATESARKELKKHYVNIRNEDYVDVRAEKIILETGEVEVLLTSILDNQILSSAELKELYYKRWGIEVRIGVLKNIIQLEIYSSHLKNGIEQDFYTSFLLSNLHSLIESDAQTIIDKKKVKKYKHKVNISASFNHFKKALINLFFKKCIEKILLEIIIKFTKHTEPIRPNRKVKRVKVTNKRYGKNRTQKNFRKNI